MERLRFDVYGHFRVVVHRGPDGWWVAEEVSDEGKRRFLPSVVIPPDAGPDEIADHLEVMFHEAAQPGGQVTLIE